MSQKFEIHQTIKNKNVHESDSYFQKHVLSERTRIGCHIIGLNEHRAIENTTKHDSILNRNQMLSNNLISIRPKPTKMYTNKDKTYMNWMRIYKQARFL